MAKHKRNRNFTVTRQRATARAEKEHAMPKCTHCGEVGGHHAAGCPDGPRPVGGRPWALTTADPMVMPWDALQAENEALKLSLRNAADQLTAAAARAERMASAVTRQRSEIDLLRAAVGSYSVAEDLERVAEVFRKKQKDAYDAPIERSIYADMVERLERLIGRVTHAASQSIWIYRPTLTPIEFKRLYENEWPSEQPPAAEQGGGA